MWNSIKVLLVVLLIGVSAGAFGAPWAVRGNNRRIDTLVITGNYKSPRLLAELILNESRQPYLLIPAANSTEKYNFLVLAKTKKAIPVTDEKFNYLVRNTGAKRIVILGDYRYVPEKYEALLDKKIPVIRIHGDDWNRVADELTYILNLSSLMSQYRQLRPELVNDSYYYRPENPRLPVQGAATAGTGIPAARRDASPAAKDAAKSAPAPAPETVALPEADQETVDAKAESVEAKPESVEAKPESAEAKPDAGEVKAKSDSAE